MQDKRSCSPEKLFGAARPIVVGARGKWVKDLRRGTGRPSPLAGEGGEAKAEPGEGAYQPLARPKRLRPARGLSNAELRSPERTAKARKLRAAMTDAERALWRLLRSRHLGGHKFRRQFSLGPYGVDFVCLEARLVIEADGGQHVEAATDATRDAWLGAQGFRVMRFWNNDILANAEGVLTALRAALPEQTAQTTWEFAR